MRLDRYPKIHILSKNEFAKHISHQGFSKNDAQKLINDVIANSNRYWKDSVHHSEPTKNKYVRNAKGTPLGFLLHKINTRILAPHDRLLPPYIFGGVKGSNHVKALLHLLGKKRKRTLLGLDITRFFEQVDARRVAYFFQHRCGCSRVMAKVLSNLCCVNTGPKNNPGPSKTLARGFATSTRLAVWCNLDVFIKLHQLVNKKLKGKDPRIGIYIDDIGVTASRVDIKEMEELRDEIKALLESDRKQKLPLNLSKTKIISHENGIEHLGARMERNKLSLSGKTLQKLDGTKNKLKKSDFPGLNMIASKRKYKALKHYKNYLENAHK